MSRGLRVGLILICVFQLLFAAAFFFQWPPAIGLWPIAGTTPLTYILLASFFAVNPLVQLAALLAAAGLAVGAGIARR